MVEEWKDVVGWEGKYKVSNLGRVWNKLTDVEVAQVLTGIPQYQHIYTSLRDGLSQDQALARYDEFLQYGLLRRKVDWKGKEVYLTDLCEEHDVDYFVVINRLKEGWDLWNAICSVPMSHPYSFEILDSKGVGHWYKNNDMFESTHPSCLGLYKSLIKEGKTLCEILAYDGKDHLRQTVLGVTGTIKELCAHFEVSESAVLTSMQKKGLTLEKALTSPRQRVKRLGINGVYNSPKYWYESFGINAKRANGWKANKEGRTFKDTFEYFGIDTSDMEISLI